MKNSKLNFMVILFCIFCNMNNGKCQSSSAGLAGFPNVPSAGGDFLGWAAGSSAIVPSLDIRTNDIGIASIPIDFFTNNTQRMRLHSGGELSLATYLAVNPLPIPGVDGESQFNVRGRANFLTGAGWHGAIKVENHAAIIYDNDQALPCATPPCNTYYFMAHPSGNPEGDTYHGLIPRPDGVWNPQYIYKIYGKSRVGPVQAFQGTHQYGTPIYIWPINDINFAQSSGILPPCSVSIAPTLKTTPEGVANPFGDLLISF